MNQDNFPNTATRHIQSEVTAPTRPRHTTRRSIAELLDAVTEEDQLRFSRSLKRQANIRQNPTGACQIPTTNIQIPAENSPNSHNNTLSISQSIPEYNPESGKTADAAFPSSGVGLLLETGEESFVSSPTSTSSSEERLELTNGTGVLPPSPSPSQSRRSSSPSRKNYRPGHSLISFSKAIAQLHGINVSVVAGMLALKAQSLPNIRDERRWFFDSLRKLPRLFPYLSVDKIRGAINKAIQVGLIIRGNYNRHGYDRTGWYSPEPPLIEALGGEKLYFSREDAIEYGVDAAIIRNHLIRKEADSIRPASLSRYLPLSVKRINKAVKTLKENGVA